MKLVSFDKLKNSSEFPTFHENISYDVRLILVFVVEQYYLPGYDTQRGNVYEFYVLSSLGSSIYITSEDPFLLRYNDTNDSKLCISPAAVGPRMFTSLQYSICQSNTIQETHAATTLMSHIKSIFS
jgi:hypothetical protein